MLVIRKIEITNVSNVEFLVIGLFPIANAMSFNTFDVVYETLYTFYTPTKASVHISFTEDGILTSLKFALLGHFMSLDISLEYNMPS